MCTRGVYVSVRKSIYRYNPFYFVFFQAPTARREQMPEGCLRICLGPGWLQWKRSARHRYSRERRRPMGAPQPGAKLFMFLSFFLSFWFYLFTPSTQKTHKDQVFGVIETMG